MDANPAVAHLIEGWLDEIRPELVAEELRSLAGQPDLVARLSELGIPIHIRTGELDVATPPAGAQALVDACLQATTEVVSGCGHLLHHEDPTGTVAWIQRVLDCRSA